MRAIWGRSIVVLAVLVTFSCDDGGGASGPSSTVASVAVIPGVFSLVVGDSLRMTTISRGTVGNPLVGRSVVWTTSGPAVVTVSQSGMVTGVGVGSTSITATVEGKIGTAAVSVSPRFPGVVYASVAAGGAHSCALTTGGAAHCWGRGESGQLGVPPPAFTCLLDPSIACSLVPIPVEAALTFQRLSAGGTHTCGLTSDGSAYCWGSNSAGQLGDNSVVTRNAPVAVATALKFASIDAGPEHTCGLTSDSTAYCWGGNSLGQLGDGSTTNRSVPVPVTTGGLTFRLIVAGGSTRSFTCALTSSGEPYCWGFNDRGQLGRGTRDNAVHSVPAPVSGGFKFAVLTAGLGDHVCGLTAAGAAYCWGGNSRGTLGDGSTRGDSPIPVAVSGGIAFAQLVTGGFADFGHTCGLTSTGAAYCWGDNEVGAVGDGSAEDRPVPTAVAGGLMFASIAAGFRHTCGRTNTGTVYCWGSGRTGQLGNNYSTSSAVPVKVIGQP